GYAMVATFHMKQNFVDFLPWSHRYRGRLPFVSLQDAHGPEPWWWTDDLAAHRTIFLAEAPTWEGWLKALANDWVVSVRRDAVTHQELRMTGGAPGVQDLVRRLGWEDFRRPLVSIVALRPDDPFEEGCPPKGLAFRVRLAGSNNPQGRPLEPLVEIESLRVDGRVVEPRLVERKGAQGLTDVYRIFEMAEPSQGIHRAEVTVRPKDGSGSRTASVETQTH
ncbi:MAG TPA: prenyltransferase, partial [Planctomycetota bacterium]|nr:prenyltransferase [Planctomycetota bacterium]